ncbi:MAG: hypothetical protein WC137_01205 [Alphaproteobacteria bacterium]
MLQNSKIEFPSESLFHDLSNRGIRIDEPLFCKYILPDGLDEQSLQDIVKNTYITEDKKEISRLFQLGKQIKLLNPQLQDVKIIPGSPFDIRNFLHGVASRFTARDIKYFLSSRSQKKDKLLEARRELQDERIKKYLGNRMSGFIPSPEIVEKIIIAIDKKEDQDRQDQEINRLLDRQNPRGYMEP